MPDATWAPRTSEVAEQIQSMGATVVQRARHQQFFFDGYAKALSKDEAARAARTDADESAKADVVITTALVRDKAVSTINAAMLASRKPGNVTVDLAASVAATAS